MKRTKVVTPTTLATLICLMLLSTLAGATGSGQPVSVRDDDGRVLTLPRPASRIITLAPHLTELVASAGGGDKLVAVTRFSDFPASVRTLPQVGDAFALDFEAIVKLQPDLVLAWKSGIGQRQRDRLLSLGLTVYDSEIGSIDDMTSTLQRFGTLMGTEQKAQQTAALLQGRWQTLNKRYAAQRPVRVFYQLSDEPLMTVSGRHLISRTIETCGGVNAFAGLSVTAPVISWEAAATADPQLIATAVPEGQLPRLGRWPSLASVNAVRNHRYALLPPDLLSRMGPRFIDGAELLCRAIDETRKLMAPR